MKRSAVFCLAFILAVLILAVGSGRAIAQEKLPERSTIATRIQALQAEETLDEGLARELEALNRTLSALDRLEAAQQRLQSLDQRIQQAPDELLRLERELSRLEDAPSTQSAEDLGGRPIAELESQLQESLTALQRLQDRQAEINANLIATQTVPERAQQSISDAMQRLERTRRELEEAERNSLPGQEAAITALQIEQQVAELELRLHQRELTGNTRLRELAMQRRELLAQQLSAEESSLAVLQSVIDRQRRLQSEQAIADAARNDPLIAEGHPIVLRAQQINRDLSLELLRATDRTNRLTREGIAVRSELDRVRQLQRSLTEQIDAIRGSQLLSRILREQQQALPQVNARRDLQEEIADLRLKQFELGRQRESLRNAQRLATQRLEEAGVEETAALVDSLQRLYQSRRELVDQLEQEYGGLLTAAIDLQLNQQQLLTISRDLRTVIDEQLFWVANARGLDLTWLRQLPATFRQHLFHGEWTEAMHDFWERPSLKAGWGLPPLLLAAILLWLRPRIRRYLETLHAEVGRLKRDSQRHTPLAIVLNLLIALPGPLVLVALGTALILGGGEFPARLGQAVWHLALGWAVIGLSRRLLVRDGVATKHFTWPVGYARRLRWLLLWLGMALIPVLSISALSADSGSTLAERPLALLAMVAGLVAMSVLMVRLILAHTPFFGVKLFRLALGLALASVPIVLLILIGLGYEYTALSLVERFVITLYLLGLWILVEAAVIRGLAVAARRLAYRRALSRRRAQVQEGAEGGLEVIEEPPLDMEQVNQQSLRLSKLILLVGFSVILYFVWSDLLAVLGYLDQVSLWQGQRVEGEGVVASAVSVADIVTALVLVALTFMMARNLPGLLEVMVLSRLSLKQGSAYAITSLLSYSIVGTGVVVSLATLGVSWDKLQWLVAALGVGLGFGLQEIFANFISGLIILFERPVRIGDTITLGNLHGTVSRIRIRATTVTDFDRKEIIIPNKTFVTDQLINWSLSDNITRVVLSVGVAYGSDLALVHRLLHQAAKENARVLADPEPQVFFMNYGASTLNFELRIFVNALTDRLFATDEVNTRIDALFREHGVEIAFNQLDVWLHSAQGQAVQVLSQPLGNAGPSPVQGPGPVQGPPSSGA
ncbi:mechanosensitive channel MscK [Litchfieldella xinjiangensis]|uniref:mechanosensitive channel MscK n=1 Tax=Litchfieldella xinjiangensis TaxID=1166948 RepID=UPI000A826F16|nr:mechanosensitive channel MscK [Halomonas xinjiangensis]